MTVEAHSLMQATPVSPRACVHCVQVCRAEVAAVPGSTLIYSLDACIQPRITCTVYKLTNDADIKHVTSNRQTAKIIIADDEIIISLFVTFGCSFLRPMWLSDTRYRPHCWLFAATV